MAKVTIKSLADAFSVSKPTIRECMRQLDPEGLHVSKEGQTFVLDDELASMISAKMSQRPGYVPPKPEEDKAPSPSILEALIESQRQTIAGRDDTIDMLQARITQLETENDVLKGAIAEKDAEIRNQATRLEMARRLEGFHLPWVRKRIVSDYRHLLQ